MGHSKVICSNCMLKGGLTFKSDPRNSYMSQLLQKTIGNSTLVRFCTVTQSKLLPVVQRPKKCDKNRLDLLQGDAEIAGAPRLSLALLGGDKLYGLQQLGPYMAVEPFHPSQDVTAVHSSASYYKVCLETKKDRTF